MTTRAEIFPAQKCALPDEGGSDIQVWQGGGKGVSHVGHLVSSEPDALCAWGEILLP